VPSNIFILKNAACSVHPIKSVTVLYNNHALISLERLLKKSNVHIIQKTGYFTVYFIKQFMYLK